MNPADPWVPSRAVYVRRTANVSLLTFGFFLIPAAMIFANGGQFRMLGLLMPLAMTLIFVIEDFSKWRMVRREEWHIEDGHLIHFGPDGRAMIALAEIGKAKRRFGGAVAVELHSGQRILMRYLPDPDAVAHHINALLSP